MVITRSAFRARGVVPFSTFGNNRLNSNITHILAVSRSVLVKRVSPSDLVSANLNRQAVLATFERRFGQLGNNLVVKRNSQVTAEDQQAKELGANGTRANKVDNQGDARASGSRHEEGTLRLPVSAALALAAGSESLRKRAPILPDVTATNRELTSGAAFALFDLVLSRKADQLVVVGARQVLLSSGQADAVVANLRTALPRVHLGLESALALGVVVSVIFSCAQWASICGAPLKEVLARRIRTFNATVSRLGVANTSLVVAKEVHSCGARERRAGVVGTSATESTVSVAHNERVTRTTVHGLAEANNVTQIDTVTVVGNLASERWNRTAFAIEARMVRVLLRANIQVVGVVVSSIVDGTVHVGIRLSQRVQIVVMSTNAESAVGVALARTRSGSSTVTAGRALGGSRTLSESVGRAGTASSNRTLRSVGVTTDTALNATSFLSRSISAALAAFTRLGTALAFDDVGHTNRVDSDLVVTGLQVVVILLEVERNLMFASSQSQSALSNLFTVEHAVE